MSQTIISVDAAELATILAALRFYQQEGQGEPSNRSDSIHDIATDGDTQISLDSDGIDVLCERINLDEPVRCLIGLEGGLVSGVTSNVMLEFTVLDYDVEGCDDDEVMTIPSMDDGRDVDVYKRGFYESEVNPDVVARLYRAIETILDGQPSTEFMKFGDTIRIEMKGKDGQSLFGAIDQQVVSLEPLSAT